MSQSIDIRLPVLTVSAFLAWRIGYSVLQGIRSSTVPPLPPGPRPLPFLGNALDIDFNKPWFTYTKWRAIYGDLVYSRLLGQQIIVLNSEETARVLLDQRSANYSDRPPIATVEPYGVSFSTVLLPHGVTWRLHRRLFHQTFRSEAALSYRPMQLRKAHQLLVDISEEPDMFEAHLGRHVFAISSIIMSAVYCYETTGRDDPFVETVKRTMDLIVEATSPEKAAILGAMPWLLRLPSWFPGATFKRGAIICQQATKEMIDTPFKHMSDGMASGVVGSCMATESLKRFTDEDGSSQWETAIKDACATAFGAGSETTYATMLVFVLAMVLNPEVQELAQAEIDLVVGSDRLPDFGDRSSLPYVEAVLRETLRWHPVSPLAGIPHVATESDIFGGYFIPKGTTLIANNWWVPNACFGAMSRNEAKYPDPSKFKPERFLTPEGTLTGETATFGFGFGRRICPGRHLADASIWSAMVCMLAIFRFARAKDDEGRDTEVEIQWSHGVTLYVVLQAYDLPLFTSPFYNSYPRNFPCRIVPRVPGFNSEKLGMLCTEQTRDYP
ncbi:cytochrome P450 [Leucogyrophana mollusca]|uniref:Cytochrome P450 n=1 Tax=Leucogyrophana mollusca TaxID=85980 RepID=A0ACB8B2X1_9AGAM|nr:cytochrome P450 [Leucogyrophana mollusca]